MIPTSRYTVICQRLLVVFLHLALVYANVKVPVVYNGIIPEDSRQGDDVRLDKPLYVRNRQGIANEEICGYTIYKARADLPFRIILLEPMTGSAKISLSEANRLDFETQKEFEFEIAAHDCITGAHSIREKVIIKVEDVNDHAPKWKNSFYATEVEENRIYGHLIQLEATDEDGTEAFSKICRYKVITPDVPFSIDDEGYMHNTEPLVYAKRSSYKLQVVAEDCSGRLSSPAAVQVTVISVCRPHWTDIEDSQEFTARSEGQVRVLSNARLDLCGLTLCNMTRLTTTVKLTAALADTECDLDPDSLRLKRKSCEAAKDIIELLPNTKDKQFKDIEHYNGIFSFTGKKDAIGISPSLLGENFGHQFTLSAWMKHGDGEEGFGAESDKEHILCLSDGEVMNRHHVTLSLHNCRLVLLLRHRSNVEAELSRFQPAEWRWKIDQVCDSKWHQYTVSVNYPEVRLYIDGQRFIENDHNPEIVDDWPLHPSLNVHSTKLSIGACWQGRNLRYSQFFRGSMAGLTVLLNQTESDHVIHCLNGCSEKLDFSSLNDMGPSSSVSMNNAKTTLVINGASVEDVESLLHRVIYVNTKLKPTLGRRQLSLQTHAWCQMEKREMALEMTTAVINVVEADRSILMINSTSHILSDEQRVKKGEKLFPDLKISLFSTSEENSQEKDNLDDLLEKHELDSCLVIVDSPLSPLFERLVYSQNFAHDLGLKVDLTQDGLVISGSDKLASYEDVLRGVEYINEKPDNLTSRSFAVSCTKENGHCISNKLQINLELMHTRPTLSPAHVVDHKQHAEQQRILTVEKNPVAGQAGRPLSSKQIGMRMAVGILACVGLMVVLLYLEQYVCVVSVNRAER